MLSQHCNTPVSHDWFFDPQCHIELVLPPALVLNHEIGCILNYPHYHPMLASSDNAVDGHPMSNSLSHDVYMVVPENIARDNQQPDNLVRWRSMAWPKEIYPPSQGPPRSVDQVYTQDPGIIEQKLEISQYTDMDHPIRISTTVHGLAPLYYPSAFFHTLGLHNINLFLLHLQHLEAMPPRAETWDENGQNAEIDRSTSESRVPTPPWLEDPKPWLMSAVAAHVDPMQVEPQTTEETRSRECLKVRLDLRRLQTDDIVPMELDPITSEDTRDSETLKIKIDLRRLLLLRKARSLRGHIPLA